MKFDKHENKMGFTVCEIKNIVVNSFSCQIIRLLHYTWHICFPVNHSSHAFIFHVMSSRILINAPQPYFSFSSSLHLILHTVSFVCHK